MNPVDRSARLGWFATAAFAFGALGAFGAIAGCGGTQAVGTTSTTSASVVDPNGPELYPTRLRSVTNCGDDLRQNVDFVPRSAAIDNSDLPDLNRWAGCLNEPEMKHTTVVLLGGQSVNEPENLFAERATRVRNALVARGVDARRIVIGTHNASRDGTPFAGNTGVRLEITHRQQLREFVPPDTGAQNTLVR
jgi:hypothetical protein